MKNKRFCVNAVFLFLSTIFYHSAFAETTQYIVKVKSYQNNLSHTLVSSIRGQAGIVLKAVNHGDYQVVTIDKKDEATFVKNMKNSSAVDYIAENRPVFINMTPSDPQFSKQSYLGKQNYSDSAISDIWNITTGNGNTTVAVVDTGILYDNPDLNYSNVLPGYNFISSPAAAGNSTGRSTDATDTGDWVDSTYLQQNPTFGCPISDSSWHGTRTSSQIAATINDGVGIAGVAHVKLLPVRALGKCGGQMFDVMQGAMWAAGIHINGVPDNPNPAKIINMSLSSFSGGCTSFEQDAVNQILAKGTIIVASAGNNNGAVGAPASCSGVIAVGAVDHLGYKSSYSNFGSQISIMTRGGDVDTYGWSDAILGVANNGLTTEGTFTYNYAQGTSFAAPTIAGGLALMNEAAGNLSLAQAQTALSAGAASFPNGTCSNGSNCVCTTSNCGVGIFNAYKSFQYLYAGPDGNGFQILGLDNTGEMPRGQNITIADKNTYNGISVSSYTWSAVDINQNPVAINSSGNQASFYAPNFPTFVTVSLTRNMSDGSSKVNHFNLQTVDHAPVVQDDSISGHSNVALTYQMKATDSDNDTLSYQIISSDIPSTSFTTFDPKTGIIGWANPPQGIFHITYNAYDGLMYSNTQTITISIEQQSVANSNTSTGGGGGGGCGIIRDEDRGNYPIDPTLPLLVTLVVMILIHNKIKNIHNRKNNNRKKIELNEQYV